MLPVLKVVALGGACAGALYCTWWMSNGSTEIPFRDLSTDNDFNVSSGGAYHNKYAADYAKYFVGVSNDAKTEPKIDNTPWWKWAFENRYKTTSTNERKKGFENKTTADQLKDACKAAYQKETNKVKPNASGDQEVDENNIWAFCSIGGNKPKSISEVDSEKSTYGDSNYGGKSDYAKLLISVTDEKNNWFWDVKEKEFKEMTEYPSDLGETSTSSKFKEEHSKRKQNTTQKSIKELCKDAYSAAHATNNDFPKKAVFKFCSLSGKEPNGGGA